MLIEILKDPLFIFHFYYMESFIYKLHISNEEKEEYLKQIQMIEVLIEETFLF